MPEIVSAPGVAVLRLAWPEPAADPPAPVPALPPPEQWVTRPSRPADAVATLRGAGARRWRGVVLHDQLHGADVLALLEAVDEGLVESDAVVVVTDRFSVRRAGRADRGAPSLEHVSALLRRMGWELETRIDGDARGDCADPEPMPTHASTHAPDITDTASEVSSVAAASAAWVATATASAPSRGASSATAASTAAASPRVASAIPGGMAAGGVAPDEAVEGEVRATLIGRRAARPDARLVRVDAAKADAMRGLFERVFGSPMSAGRWQWKYGEGRGVAVGLWSGDGLVAHYGGFTRSVLFHGRPARACQVGDVMVLPSANRSLSRAGPMSQVGATFAAFEVGYGLPHLVGYGFPSARAFGVAQRLGLYAEVDQIVQVEWSDPPPAAPPTVRAERIDVQAARRPDVRQAIDRSWAAMAAALTGSIVGVRDAAWLVYRYLEHPELDYEVWRVRSRWLRRDLGLVVLRRHAQHVELLDVVGPPGHMAALVNHARRRTAELGQALLRCWVTRSHLEWLVPGHAQADASAPHSPRVVDIGVRVPTTIHTEGPPLEHLRGRWWLMGGDADFT